MGSSGFNWKLADHPKLPKGKTVGLIVLDGWGEANPDQYNCIHVAETPVMDSFKKAGGEMLAELVGITLGPELVRRGDVGRAGWDYVGPKGKERSTTAVILAHGLITEVVKDNLMCTKMLHLGTPLKT